MRPIIVALIASAGCDTTSVPPASVVRDSAGVTIITSNSGEWSEAEAWRVAQVPSVTIGAVEGDPAYELSIVTDAARLSDGRLAIVNAGTQEIRLYDADGSFLNSFGRDGEGPGEFRLPTTLLPFADSLFIWDFRLLRMSVFTTAGDFVRSFLVQATGSPGPPSLSGQFADGSLLMSPRGPLSWRETGEGLQRGPAPYVVHSLRGDSVGAFTWLSPEVTVRAVGERVATLRGPLNRRTYVAVTDTSAFVGNNEAYVIDEYGRDGRLLRSLRRPVDATPVTDERVAQEAEAVAARFPEERRPAIRRSWLDMPRPSVLPFYGGLEVAPDGHIWVKEFGTRWIPNNEWSVFDPDGRLLGQVEMRDRFRVFEIGSDYVLGVWRDEDDVEHVMMYELVKPES